MGILHGIVKLRESARYRLGAVLGLAVSVKAMFLRAKLPGGLNRQ